MIGVFKDPKVLSLTYLQEGILRFCYYLRFGVILDPELSWELLSTYLEAHYRNDIFLNNHHVGEDYDKCWHLSKTD